MTAASRSSPTTTFQVTTWRRCATVTTTTTRTLRLDPTDRTLTLIRPDRTQPARRDRPASRHRPLTPPELHSGLMAICAVEHPRLQVLRALRQQHKVDGVDDAVALL